MAEENGEQAKKKPAVPESVRDIAAMIMTLETEIQESKNGQMNIETARVVTRLRGLQLQAASLNLQYQRMNRNKPVKSMPLSDGNQVIDS